MLQTLLLSMSLAWAQNAAPPPQAPAFITADIAQLTELLELETSQHAALRMLLTDHELDWHNARARVIDDLHRTPAWAQAISAESTWRAASERSRAAHRALSTAQRQSLDGTVDAHAIAQLRLAVDAAERTAASTRAAMFDARRTADPNHAHLFAQLDAAHDGLSQELDSSIAGLLDRAQQTMWPTARQTVRRARRLRALRLPGASTDLRGLVLRRVGLPDETLQRTIDAWGHETDALLDHIEGLQLDATTSQDDVLAAALFRDADRLQAVQADYTLRISEQVASMHPQLARVPQELRADAFPLTWGPTSLHALLEAADKADDIALLSMVQAAIANFSAAVDARADTWQSIEREGRLAQLMRMRGLSADAIDADALQRAGDTQRALRRERDALVQASIRSLLQSTTREHVLRVLPGMPLPPG